jgi:hypothetical protein
MRNTVLGPLLAAAAALAAVAVMLGPLPASGQGPVKAGGPGGAKQAPPPGPVPRTKEGKPDMSGFWSGVTPSAAVNIEPTKGKAGKGKNLIVSPEDGFVPYTPAARAKVEDIVANRMYLEPELHCFMSGVPHNMWVQFGMQALQTKEYLVFAWEFQHSRRIIPLDGRPHQFPPSVRQFQGESVGHWEGDTLVVVTKNQTDKTWFDTSGRFAPKDIEVEERFTMINANQIDYEATVTSAAEFTQPMKLKGVINRAEVNNPGYEQMEFGCIEGNEDLKHYPESAGGKAKHVGARTQ